MKQDKLPKGWDENRVHKVLTYYEGQSEEEALAEDEQLANSPDIVFVLWHVHKLDDGSEDEKCIGVYRTKELAAAAAERLKTKPGFVDAPDGFVIDPYQLDQDGWEEGYTTIVHG